ncbi:MAG: MFS transporter [Pseudomonadota bacterium]
MLEPPRAASVEGEPQALLTRPFLLMLSIQFCFGLSYSSFFLLPKYLTRQFHAGAAVIGAVAATALLAGVLAVPLIGALIDRGSRRRIIGLGAIVNALSACGFALVPSISFSLYALRAIHGVSYALVFNAIVTWAADLSPPKKLSQAIGLAGAASLLANAVAPAGGEYIADHYGWAGVFLAGGGAALVAAVLALGIREPRAVGGARAAAQLTPLHVEHGRRAEDGKHAGPPALRIVLAPVRAGAFVCSFAVGSAFGVMFTFTQPYALLLGADKVSNFFVGYTACAMGVRLLLGSVADRVGRRPIVFVALGLYGLVACVTSQLHPHLLFPIGALLGCAHGLIYPALNALAVEGVTRARRGAVMTYFLGCFNAGFAFWVLAMGVIAKAYGYPVLFVATGLLVWLSMSFVPKPGKLAT